jgi:hypothetical protein
VSVKAVTERKGQYSVMEYLFLSLFVIFIIVGMMIFLFVFQVGQNTFSIEKNTEAALFSVTNRVIGSQFLVRGNSEFDDAKLTALQDIIAQQGCIELERMFGKNVFINITDLNLTKEIRVGEEIDTADELPLRPCDASNYGTFLPAATINGIQVPEGQLCNHWSLCFEGDRQFRANVLPVNILRRIGRVLDSGVQEQMHMGVVTVGIYTE